MEEGGLDFCQVALQENGACGQNGTYMYKCLPPNIIYCGITIHTHNTSTYHDSTGYTEWVTLWSGESSKGWWSWKWSYTVTHTSVCTWSCSQDSSWVGRERREYFHSVLSMKTSNKLFPWAYVETFLHDRIYQPNGHIQLQDCGIMDRWDTVGSTVLSNRKKPAVVKHRWLEWAFHFPLFCFIQWTWIHFIYS